MQYIQTTKALPGFIYIGGKLFDLDVVETVSDGPVEETLKFYQSRKKGFYQIKVEDAIRLLREDGFSIPAERKAEFEDSALTLEEQRKLEQIAMACSEALRIRGGIDKRGNDEDSPRVDVVSVQRMLEKAYLAGRESTP